MDDVKLAEALSDHKHRIGSLEHRMEKAENLIEEILEICPVLFNCWHRKAKVREKRLTILRKK